MNKKKNSDDSLTVRQKIVFGSTNTQNNLTYRTTITTMIMHAESESHGRERVGEGKMYLFISLVEISCLNVA